MLNISKISKTLLALGIVTAFSFATLNINMAYAYEDHDYEYVEPESYSFDEEGEVEVYNPPAQASSPSAADCLAAKKKVDDEKKKLEKELKALQNKTKDAQKAVNKAKSECKTELEYCTAYQSALATYNAAVKAENEKKASNDKEIKKLISTESEKCQAKTTAEGEGMADKKSAKDQKKTEKTQNAKSEAEKAANEANAKLKKEQDKVANQEKVVKEKQEKMNRECASPKPNKCEDAQKQYAEAVRQLNEDADAEKKAVKDAQKEANKANKKSEKANEKDEKRAQKAVDNAQKDVDKFCALGTISYNESKCKKAKNELATAQADSTYQKMTESEREAAERQKKQERENAALDAALKGEELDEIRDSVSNAAQNYVSEADLIYMQGDLASANKELTLAENKKKELEEAQKVACAKPKSNACKNANADLQSAEAELKRAEEKQKQVEDNYNHAKAKNKAAKEAIDKDCGTAEQKASEECLEAMQYIREQELGSALKNSEAAEREVEKCQSDLDKAEQAYNDALSRQAIACSGSPSSEACQAATSALADAKAAKERAEFNLDIANSNLVMYNQAVATAQQNYESADAALDAHNAEAARQQRQERADRICEEKGEKSLECILARERVDNPDSKKIGVFKDVGGETLGGFNYNPTSGDVFDIVTRRAAAIILQIKPIVYIIAGFGLIMFAWGAIFNKISWKHFSSIAIGLFLVANMGQLIEYVVSNGDEGYYLGQWESSTAKKDDSNRMSHAFKDTYRVYGYELVNPPFNETPKSPAQSTPKKSSKDEVATETSVVQDEMQKRGYCQGTGSIWSSIKSCVGDIVGSINKAANVVKTTVSTVNHVKNRAADVAQSAKSIANAFGTIKNGDVMSGLGAVLNNIDRIGGNIGSAKGAVETGSNTIIENISTIGSTNDAQSGKVTTNLGQGLGSVGSAIGSVKNMFKR